MRLKTILIVARARSSVGQERRGSSMVEDLSGSVPKYTISPEDLNAILASTFAGHIGQ
jgi:hypothetical protein